MYLENYGPYAELVQTKSYTVYTKDLNSDNIDDHFKWIINILYDGIEEESIQNLKLHIVFSDNVEINLMIIDYMFNLMFWSIIVSANHLISSFYFFNCITEPITKNNIKRWIDDKFIDIDLKTVPNIKLNQFIDRGIGKFRDLENFQMYLANTVNLEDTIDLMNKYPEFNDTVHFDISGIPLEDVKNEGLKVTNKQIEYIKNSDHCLKDAFISEEGINVKQFKEVQVNIGSKPDGQGGVFPDPIKGSFINGGLQDPEELIIESSIGRIAQILQKQNVGQSGAFARLLGLNNQDSKLHPNPHYICNSKNFETITIDNKSMLYEFNMRYYRFTPNGMEYRINYKKDLHLIGKTILLRSPITCASAARGEGICYRCYGDLAYVNNNVNIGQMASEELSSKYTQILLSAKHLLESAILKKHWAKGFEQLFNVDYNQILLKDELSYRGMKIIIEDYYDDEDEDAELDSLTCYIFNFDVVYPNGNTITINSYSGDTPNNDYDQIYLHDELIEYMEKVGLNDDGVYELDMDKLKSLSALFVVDVKNNELSKTMKAIKNIIDNKLITKSYNRSSILYDFINTNLAGNIKMASVHFEVIIMNQIRSAYDILELPDWTNQDEPYQILTLDESLINNRSISVRLQSSKISKTLTSPTNRRLHVPSNMDLFYMTQPQNFMGNDYIKSTYEPKAEERVVIKPFYEINSEDDNSNH